jgi:hypothetical protein
MLASLVLTLGLVGFCQAQPPGPLPPLQITPSSPKPVIQPVRGQPGGAEPKKDADTYTIPLDPPGPEILFRLDSEPALQERIRQEFKRTNPNERIVFPDEPVLSKSAYYGRNWPAQQLLVEPQYVCHGRLFFEEKNAERYGWELGVLQPIVSAAAFFKDVALLPMHMGTEPCRCFDCSAGKCLPGDPVPLIFYPPEVSLTGAAYQAAVVGTLIVMFP